jgi:pyrrolysine biosynthesis protein PylD
VALYDINPRFSREFKDSIIGSDSDRLTIEQDIDKALTGHSLIVDATNTAAVIHARDVSGQTYIAAPGMPLGLSGEAFSRVADRLLHDPLQIGVATMGMMVVKQISPLQQISK